MVGYYVTLTRLNNVNKNTDFVHIYVNFETECVYTL